MVDFRVDLDSFRGPIDLLLYLVRKNEVDILNIPIHPITLQYHDFLDVLVEMDINAVGDFLEMASILLEIKAKLLLPSDNEIVEEQNIDDPREDLVQRLLEYKKFKDAACELDERGRQWRQRYVRVADDLPTRKVNMAEQPIRDLEMWDLVSSFGRLLKESAPPPEANIVYDDTPIHVYMEDIHKQLSEGEQVKFSEMFRIGMHKSAMIGVFLAILELIRHHSVNATQSRDQNDIVITKGESFDNQRDFGDVDDYGSGSKQE